MQKVQQISQILTPDAQGIAQAAALLQHGQLVAIPTETVYGLAADARNEVAVRAIFAAKGRPAHNPLIVHVPSLSLAQELAELPDTALRLADIFWPGPLTLVVPLRLGHGLAPEVTAGLKTVALRLPAHPAARALLEKFHGPIAAPSANPSGRISPTTPAHVIKGLGSRIAAVLDGGACSVGIESTILGFEDDRPVLLRAGGIPSDALEEVLGTDLGLSSTGTITAPGQLMSHYAPRAHVRLDVTKPRSEEIWIGFGPECAGADFSLSPTGDLDEAAMRLFAVLHDADQTGRDISIAPIPQHGLGLAINDRLQRAAAPRDS